MPQNFVTSVALSTTIRNNFAGWLGMKLTTGTAPVTIRELGRWVIAGNTAAHTVKLVDAATNVDVPGGSVSIKPTGRTGRGTGSVCNCLTKWQEINFCQPVAH